MHIALASTSEHKIEATREAAIEAYAGKTMLVTGYKAASGINEQPIGHNETLRGALNRLAHLKRLVGGTRHDLLVAMEGGLFAVDVDGRDQWFDCGWVVAEDADGRRGIAHCTGVRFNDDDVNAARALGFETTTVGSILAKRVGADGTDPHAYLTDSILKRSHVLKQALIGAFGQIRMQMKKA